MQLWRHKKRGSEYLEIGRATLQNSGKRPLSDDAVMIVYQSAEGRLFVRAEAEFLDGRFERVGPSC
jgi:hypothetical protein